VPAETYDLVVRHNKAIFQQEAARQPAGPETILAPPPNDNFNNAITLTGPGGSMLVNNIDATLEAGEPCHLYLTEPPSHGNNSVWWKITPTTSGIMSVDTRGSVFHTILAVYTGTTINNLNRIRSGHDYVYFDATAGQAYYIAIMGRTSADTGLFTLNYYQDTFSSFFTMLVTTNTTFLGVPARDGSILTYPADILTKISIQTNRYNIIANVKADILVYPNGISITDRKGNTVQQNIHPVAPGLPYRVMAYNGKYVYIYNQTTATLTAYRVTRKGLKAFGSHTTTDLSTLGTSGSKVFLLHQVPSILWPAYHIAYVTVMDRKLNKTLWSITPDKGLFRAGIPKKGIFVREKQNTYTLDFVFTDENEVLHTRNVVYPRDGNTQFCIDKKCGFFYWTSPFAIVLGMGIPVTYIDHDGVVVMNSQLLDNRTDIQGYVPYSVDYVYGLIPATDARTISAYQIGKKIKAHNEQTVSKYHQAVQAGSGLLAQQYDMPGGTPNYGFVLFDMKLKKAQWTEPMAEGALIPVDNKTFCRIHIRPSGSSTIYTYTIFNRKKTIAEHQFIR
jgi:hypothetical protein